MTVLKSSSMQWREGCGGGKKSSQQVALSSSCGSGSRERGLEIVFLGVLVSFPVVGVKCPDKSHLREKGLTQLIAPDYSPSWGGRG